MFTQYSPSDIAELLDAAKMAKVPIVPIESNHEQLIDKKDSTKINFKLLTQYCQVKRFIAGSTLFNYEDIGKEAYLIMQGIAEITLGTKLEKMLKEGDLVGETGLISEAPRRQTCTFITDGIVLIITNTELLNIIIAEPSIGYKLILALIQYINSNSKVESLNEFLEEPSLQPLT